MNRGTNVEAARERVFARLAPKKAKRLRDCSDQSRRELNTLVEEELDLMTFEQAPLREAAEKEKALAPNKHSVKVGDLVLFTRREGDGPHPALVTKTFATGSVNLCAFTPGPEPAWTVDYDAKDKPGTYRRFPRVVS